MPEPVSPPRRPAASPLRPPDARQGPGPMPNGLVEALEPAINRLVAQLLPGGRRAVGVGFGTELAQLRPYETGDDVRHIDAAASARTGTLHMRLHVPERTLTTWIVLDLSPSMAFGTARRLKADVAEGVALVFGRLGLRRAGSVGVVAFGVGADAVADPAAAGLEARDDRAAQAARGGCRARSRRRGRPSRTSWPARWDASTGSPHIRGWSS